MSKGLQNACRKKNTLYTLTNIMRNCKKDFYNKLLENNKHNIKGIWNTLNSVIRNKSRQNIHYPNYFVENDNIMNNMDDVVNIFNDFFCKCGTKSSRGNSRSSDIQ